MPARTRETSAEWAAGIPDHVTAKQATTALQGALDYADDAVNAVLSLLGGTTPPPRAMMPDLYTARDKVAMARDAIGALAERSPDVEVNPIHASEGKKLGVALIDAANAAMDRAKQPDSTAQLVATAAQAGARVASKAAGGLLSFAGRALTPMEIAFGALVLDELLTGGKYRRKLFKV